MWLIVCTSNREYSVVSEEDVLSGNVSCGSRVKAFITDIEKEVTVIFIGKNRSQCDQYCHRLSRYCGPADPVESQKASGDEARSGCGPTIDESLLETSEMKHEPGVETCENGEGALKISDVAAARILANHDDVAPSTSSEPDNNNYNEGANVEVPHFFFMELLRTMKKLRSECGARFNRLDNQLEDMVSRMSAIEEFIRRDAGAHHSIPSSTNNGSSLTSTQIGNNDLGVNMFFDSSPNEQTSKLQYPYPHLSEVDVDAIQREAKSITSFARKVDRILFASDPDKDSPIDARKDKAKVWFWSGKHLNESERVHLLQLVANRSHEEAAAEFNRLHPNREPIRQSSVTRLIAKFKETGSIMDRPRCGRPRRSTDGVNTAAIVAKFRENPEKSLRQMANETGMSRSSIHRILRAYREKL
ncbi:unnamed protein product [Angiostrongylus costaricensis]|uniref:DUF4817 domain-containing protein n=1 Tax=Angiostrongylus costaricensis TaxID=334426 RepID=A0A0R3PCA8_ANGCS|nr:unnamed protein product [Angiostrongylus costaricensis]